MKLFLMIVFCVVGALLLAVINDAYPEITFELTATVIIVLTGMIGLQKNYRKSKRSDLTLGENEALERKNSVEKNVRESTSDRIKRKQGQLQKLTFMIKTMDMKGQTKDQIRNNLSQMGWPEKALDQAFATLVK